MADTSPQRLAFVQQWLQPDHLLAPAADPLPQLKDLTNGDLPTAVFDCTGSAASMTNAFGYVAHGGRLVMVSLVQADLTFNDPEFHRRELTLLASRNATHADFGRVIQAMATGAIVTEPLTRHRVPLDDVVAAFPAWLEPDSGVLKAIIEL